VEYHADLDSCPVGSEILPTQWILGGQARLWLAADGAAAREIAAAAVVVAESVVE